LREVNPFWISNFISFKAHFNIVFPYTPISSKWSPPLMFSDQTFRHVYHIFKNYDIYHIFLRL
jgi:hypothetical protein